MAIDWNEVVSIAESSLVTALKDKAVAGLISAIPWLSFLSGPLGWLFSYLIALGVKYGDWLLYFAGDSWMNSQHAENYQKAGEALQNLPPTANKEEIDAAKKAKADALDALMGAS